MKKIFILILITGLSLLVIGCKSNSKDNKNEIINLNDKKLSETETIIITKLATNNKDSEIKKIADKDKINNIITILSGAIKTEKNEDISSYGEIYILEMHDNNDIILATIKVSIYTGNENKILDCISIDDDNYSLEADTLIKLFEF